MTSYLPDVDHPTSRATSRAPVGRAESAASSGLLLTTRQAAALIAVTPHWLARLRTASKGPAHYRAPDGSAIYLRSDLITWATFTRAGGRADTASHSNAGSHPPAYSNPAV